MSRSGHRQVRRVFVDSSAYFALVHQPDRFHVAARTALERYAAQCVRFFTTNFILAELHTLLLARVNRRIALVTLSEIDSSRLTTVVRQQDEQRARAIIARYDDKDFSLTDAISFAVMERLGITRAFSFDHNFAQYGWIVPSADEERR